MLTTRTVSPAVTAFSSNSRQGSADLDRVARSGRWSCQTVPYSLNIDVHDAAGEGAGAVGISKEYQRSH